MIVFSAKLIDHTPHRAICLLKGHPGPGKVERREQRAVVTTRPGRPGLWGYVIETGDGMRGQSSPLGPVVVQRWADSVFPGKPGLDPNQLFCPFCEPFTFI